MTEAEKFIEKNYNDNNWGFYPPSKRLVCGWLEKYHKEQLALCAVVGRSEQLVCDVCESDDNIQTYCGKCMEDRC